jgi:uncharacterized protein (DUF2147 family)
MLIWLLIASCFAQIEGQWLTTDKSGVVEVKAVNGKYQAVIVDGTRPKDAKDEKNPDENLRSRLLLGMELFSGLMQDEDDKNEFYGGKIYDPDNGKTYKCKATLKGDVLEIRGFIGISLIGRTVEWTRIKPQPLSENKSSKK